MIKSIYTLFGLLCFINKGNCDNKTSLIQNIFTEYNNQASPQINSEPVNLSLGLALRAFKTIDQMEGTISANIWLRYKWYDPRLSWNMETYNYSFISLNTNPELDYTIWTPDIYLYNTAEKPLNEIDFSRAIVKNNGEVIWSRPGIITSTCSFDLTHFPYDRQNCYMKFGSWSYDNKQIDIFIYDSGFDISNFIEHEEWVLTDYYCDKNVQYYSCCTEAYPDIKFHYTINRRSGYYDLNIVLPTFATASLVLLTLLVPWSSGERISFAVTVMLSIIVFLLILSDNLPKSDQKPLLSRMIIGLTLFSLLGVFFTIIISALSDYNDKFKKDENTTTNKIILNLHKFFKRFETCTNKPNNDIENNVNSENENNQEFETTIDALSQNNLNVENNLIRSNSYRESIRKRNIDINQVNRIENNQVNRIENNKDEKIIKEECEKMINYFEHIYMIVFFFAFIIYCIIMFAIIPQYD